MALRMYPPRPIIGQDLSGEKVVVVPNQSLTLKQILQRYVRRESLPYLEGGIYGSQLGELGKIGDLEKMSKMDITFQTEIAGQIKAQLKSAEKRRAAKVESPPPVPSPAGAVTGSTGAVQAPPSPSPQG